MSPANIVVLTLTLITVAFLVVIEMRSRRNTQASAIGDAGEPHQSGSPASMERRN